MSSLAARRAKAGADHASPTTATEAFNRMNERPRDVLLNEITLDLGLQFRLDVKGTGGIDEKHVLDLMHVIADGADTDPVILYRVDNALLMVDGFHRFEAYQRSQRTSIPAIVRDGTYEDAEEAAENANLQFKKALGDESKKYIFARRVQRGYQTGGVSWNNLSDKAIAAELGVAYQTIDRWFEEIQSGVTFVTPAGHEISIQVSADRSVVYGRDGKRYEVEAIREANTKRAAEAAERRAIDEAERKRTLPAIEKIRLVTQYLISKYRDDQKKKGKPLLDDPDKGYKWCYQVSNPTFVVDIDWERQFLAEYGARPVGLYREFLRMVDQATFIEADMDHWSDEQMADWVYAMKQRGPRQMNPPTETFQRGGMMAQPKNPNLEYQPPTATGRHRLTEVEAEPPFRKGQSVEVFETMEKGIVHAVAQVGLDWEVQVQLYEGIKTFHADELTRPFDEQVTTALETPTAPSLDDCTFSVGQRVHMRYGDPIAGTVKDVRRNPVGDWQAEVDFGHAIRWTFVDALEDDAPFSVGQQLWVVATGEIDTVYNIQWEDGEWRVWMENGEDFNRVDELSDVRPSSSWDAGNAAEDAAVDEAIEFSLQEGEEESRHLDYDDDSDTCPFKVGDRVILKRNPKPVSVVKSVRQLKDGTWQMTMTTAEGYEFYEVPANLDFAPVESAVVIEDQAVMPFLTGDIVRDIQSGQIVEVVGFSSDGVVIVEGDDEHDKKYQYDVWAYDLEKYDIRAEPPKAVKPSGNGKRQAEMMIEDARSIIPRLVLDTTHATTDYRMTTLVRWESPKSIQTILENGDPGEINLLSRDLSRLRGEVGLAVKLLDQMFDNINAMLNEIEMARA